jgi:hypothetical protein
MTFLSVRSQQVGSGAHSVLFRGYRGSFFAGECGPSFCVEAENTWSYTSTPPCTLMRYYGLYGERTTLEHDNYLRIYSNMYAKAKNEISFPHQTPPH